MTGERLEHQSLREAFARLAAVAGDGGGCPEPDRLWASAREELAHDENETVLLHLAECTACATSWRLARELVLPAAGQPSGASEAVLRQRRSWRRWPLLAAAAVLMGFGWLLVVWGQPRATREPVYRGQEGDWLEPRVPAGIPLPRQAFVLGWAEGPPGTTYEVHVTTETLRPLASATGLRHAEHRVDAETLGAVSPGARVLWRVIAHLPDGSAVASRTFVAVVR